MQCDRQWWGSDNDNEDKDDQDRVECDYFNGHMHIEKVEAWNRMRAELMVNAGSLKAGLFLQATRLASKEMTHGL